MTTTDTTPVAPPQRAYMRFIDNGLTLDGQVWRAGAVHETFDIAVASIDPLTQRAKWGRVMFECISKEEFDLLKDLPAQSLRTLRTATMTPAPPAMAYSANGEPMHTDPGKSIPVSNQAAHILQPLMLDRMLPPEQQQLPPEAAEYGVPIANIPPPPEPAAQGPWPWYAEASDIQTITQLASMGEAQLVDFAAYERANRNRPSIIKLIETGEL